MYKIGRTLFYDKKSGLILHDTGEIQTTLPDFADLMDYYGTVKVLQERDPATVGELALEYGQYVADYAEGGYVGRIDPETGEPLFVYPDPADPETPAPQQSLSARIAKAEAENAENRNSIMELTMLLAGGI